MAKENNWNIIIGAKEYLSITDKNKHNKIRVFIRVNKDTRTNKEMILS
jgi:hypothetical protein